MTPRLGWRAALTAFANAENNGSMSRIPDGVPPSTRTTDGVVEKGVGFAGQQVSSPTARNLEAALSRWPYLEGMIVAAAGYYPRAAGHLVRCSRATEVTVLIYCVKGGGWCKVGGVLHPVHAGDLMVLPPGLAHAYGTHGSCPWTIHWAHVRGSRLSEYLHEMGVNPRCPILPLGEDLQVVGLFNEVVRDLVLGDRLYGIYHASHTLMHLMSVLVLHSRRRSVCPAPRVQKVARSIVYLSEHLHEQLRISELATLAGISPSHFSVLFRQQTGCSPKAYQHLLRMHRAVELLAEEDLTVKEIANRLGYRDAFYFSRSFKAFNGVAPHHFRMSPKSSTV